MNMKAFFEQLRTKKWVLCVPERVYRAHRDGLLTGWSVCCRDSHRYWSSPILDLLREHGVQLQIPFQQSKMPTDSEEDFIETYGSNLALFSGENRHALPTETVADDSLWDSLVSRFDLTESMTNRIMGWDGWVYRVRFTPAWVNYIEPLPHGFIWKGTDPQEKAAMRKANETARAKRRILRKKYGLTGEYFGRNYSRRAVFMILRKAYPPEQVRKLRRQLEDKLRKDPAEAIRYGLARGLAK